MLRRGLAGVLAACALAALPATASARLDPVVEYAGLAQQRLSPAPLIPLRMPAILGGPQALPATVSFPERNVYAIAFNHVSAGGRGRSRIDASILVQGLGNRSVGGRREFFGSLYRYSKTRVRRQQALLLRARFSPVRSLVWREQGRLYEVSTNTPRTISVGTLRSVAAGMQHLLGGYNARLVGAGGLQEAEALLGDRSLLLSVSWMAPCTRAGGEAAPSRTGAAELGWLTIGPGGFARGPLAAPGVAGGASWTVSANGSMSLAGGQLAFQATSATGAESCTIGPLAGLALTPLGNTP